MSNVRGLGVSALGVGDGHRNGLCVRENLLDDQDDV